MKTYIVTNLSGIGIAAFISNGETMIPSASSDTIVLDISEQNDDLQQKVIENPGGFSATQSLDGSVVIEELFG